MAVTIDGTNGITTQGVDSQGTIKLDGNYPVGTSNVALGDGALDDGSLTGGYNTAVGHGSMTANTSGQENAAFGQASLDANTTGSRNTAIGSEALTINTSGTDNTAFGRRSLRLNLTGTNNTAVGAEALRDNTSSRGTAVGYAALLSNTTGFQNTAVGYQTLTSTTTGERNTAVGDQAGYSLTTGANNTFVGRSSGGYGAGHLITTGSKNTIIGGYNGNQGGLDIRTSSNNIVLSDGDGNPRVHIDGANLVLVPTNPYLASKDSALYAFGRRSSSSGVILNHNSTSWASTSDETRKDIIEDISDATTKVAGLRTVIGKFKTDDADTRRPFLIAQDVQAVFPEAVDTQEDDQGEYLVMSYTDVIPLLTAAIKELKTENDSLKSRIEALENQ